MNQAEQPQHATHGVLVGPTGNVTTTTTTNGSGVVVAAATHHALSNNSVIVQTASVAAAAAALASITSGVVSGESSNTFSVQTLCCHIQNTSSARGNPPQKRN